MITSDIYSEVKRSVIASGFKDEIDWQARARYEDVNEAHFLRELAWVVLASGMKEKVVRQKFPAISEAFFSFSSAKTIAENHDKCIADALTVFGHNGKIPAIADGAAKVDREGFDHLKARILTNPIKVLQEFGFVGPITVYHLAKNIGLPVAKPDRHLIRIAALCGYSDVQNFCQEVSKISGDSVPVVDIVLWRYATQNPDYLKNFQ
jgi:3-methyladenine DNA glycosylase Tag